jgi:exopolyphosphatase / guanosine-5'-triphosphate,3'-diphosphate pyrophosphatase
MSAVSPGRWEWRTFGDDFGAAGDRFASLEPEQVQESDEIYLLSTAEGDTVKVRDDLMDVKHLEHVNDDGLEQWLPVMKAGFPLPASDLGSVLASLGVETPPLGREAYTLSELLDEVVGPHDGLSAVDVHKLRRRFTIGGCMTEWTDVKADDSTTRTIAVETEDPALVIAAVRDLGLESRPNTSYPRGLKALLGFGSP